MAWRLGTVASWRSLVWVLDFFFLPPLLTRITLLRIFPQRTQGGGYDGVFGLGFDEIAASNAVTPFHRLIQQHDLPEPVFAFYLGTDSPGELTIGALFVLRGICFHEERGRWRTE